MGSSGGGQLGVAGGGLLAELEIAIGFLRLAGRHADQLAGVGIAGGDTFISGAGQVFDEGGRRL